MDYENIERLEKIKGLYSINDSREDIKNFYISGQPKGSTTHFPQLDNHWTWRRTDLNMCIGFNNEGKSTFLKQLALIKSVLSGWKFVFISPEDMPRYDFYIDLLQMLVGKSFNGQYKMSKEEVLSGLDVIQDSIKVIDPKGPLTLKTVAQLIRQSKSEHNIDGFIIDPYNMISHDYGKSMREDLYISEFMSCLKELSVDQEVCGMLTAHLVTPKIVQDKDDPNFGNYPAPNKYLIKGGGTFADKADNIISVYRPNYATDKLDPSVVITSEKIRKQSLVGIPGDVRFLYSWKKYRYSLNGFNPLDNLNNLNKINK